jgi:hypothetical protein
MTKTLYSGEVIFHFYYPRFRSNNCFLWEILDVGGGFFSTMRTAQDCCCDIVNTANIYPLAYHIAGQRILVHQSQLEIWFLTIPYMPVCVSACLFVFLSVCLCLSVCLSVRFLCIFKLFLCYHMIYGCFFFIVTGRQPASLPVCLFVYSLFVCVTGNLLGHNVHRQVESNIALSVHTMKCECHGRKFSVCSTVW